MNPYFDQSANRTEVLPEEFSARQRAVDARLAVAAQLQAAPAGLNTRVFQASVSMLPRRRQSATLRLVSAGHAAFQRLTLGRLAMAAMVLLACSVAVWVMNSQRQVQSGGSLVAHKASRTRIDWLPQEATDKLDRDLSYLIDTNNLTSPDDINHDLVMLVSELEM